MKKRDLKKEYYSDLFRRAAGYRFTPMLDWLKMMVSDSPFQWGGLIEKFYYLTILVIFVAVNILFFGTKVCSGEPGWKIYTPSLPSIQQVPFIPVEPQPISREKALLDI